MKTFTTYAEKKAKQFLNLLQGYTRGIRFTAILILLLMGVNNTWAGPSFSGGYVYFHNKGGWNDNYKYLCIGKSNYTELRSMSVVTNTQLWCNSLPTSGWTDATYMAVIGNSSSWGSGSWGTSNLKNANHRTASVNLGSWGFNSNNTQMLTPANGNNDAALALTYVGSGYASMNNTITIKAKVSTNGGSSYSDANTPAKLTGSSKVFTSFTSCAGTSGASATLNAGSSSTTFKAGYTANTTLTAVAATGYTFAGWYSGSTNISDQLSTTINPTGATTYYAYYKANTYSVKFDANGGTGTMSNQSYAYGVSQALTANAFTKTGYNFAGWNTKADGTGTKYTDKQSVSNLSSTNGATITLYAQWTEKTYSLTFKHDGNGTIQVGGAAVNSGSNATVNHVTTKTLVATANTGYNFSGWTLSGNNISAVTIGNTSAASTNIKATNTGATVTANFTPITYNITYTAPINGSYTIKVGDNAAVSANTTANYKTTITLTNTPDPGYHFSKWTITPNVSITNNRTFLMPASHVKIDATFEADTYTITWNANGGSVSPERDSYTYNGDPIVLPQPTRDGYTFLGWFTSADGGDKIKDVGKDNKPTSDVEYFAQWTANTYTVTLDQEGATTTGTTSMTVTYDAEMPTITCPTKNGYAFMGYWDARNGAGKQYYNAGGTSAANWDKAANATLYAYFKKAEISEITLNKAIFDPVPAGGSGSVTATATVAPEPEGDVIICWQLLYSNGDPVAGHDPAVNDNSATFSIAGLETGHYMIRATLRTGTSCNGGTELHTLDQNFTIAANFTVTVQYTCDGKTIAAPTKHTGHATNPKKITAQEIGGYDFKEWVLGDGIYSTSTLTEKTIEYTATYNGYLTATYQKKKLIFLDISTLPNKDNWTAPHIYLYKEGGYWNNDKGAGSQSGGNFIKDTAMVKVPNTTDIWYYEYAHVKDFGGVVAFTSVAQTNFENFHNCEAIYRTDFTSGTPVFVPASDQTAETKNSTAKYYSKGYWVKYMDGTGYWLIIYNEAGDKELVRREFTSETQRMTMTSIVELEAKHTYKYEIYRNDGYYYNGGDITYTNSSNYKPLNEANKHSIKTTETGNYTFTLDYFTGDLQIKVQYPGEVGDYRILYKDDTRTTYKPSDIKKAEELNPVTSFFIRPNDDPELKIQTAAHITDGGVTWYTADNHIYFKPNENWKSDGARFAAWFNGDKWKDLNKNGDVYSCEIPSGATEVIFCRMDPKKATNNWSNNWNQTGHLKLTTENLYTLNEGEWGNKLYLKPNSYWLQKDNDQKDPRFAAYFFNSNSDNAWVSMGNPVDGVYSCDIPAKVYKNVIFCRMNGGNETNEWNNKYNQSSDLIVPTDGKTLYTVKDGTWDKGGGTWSVKEGSWSTISGSITDLSVQLKNKLAELDLKDIKETEGSVFNIHLSNNEGTLTIEKVAFYTGNFYIRVDAAAGKWYDYKTNPDNLMTYSAFSESKANSFGEKFSHYKTKWCPRGTNVKFVIANDYSPCISDTLARDLVRASGEDYMTEGGDLYQEDGGSKDPVYDRYSANIRFMWNRQTNEISRAYLASSSNDSRQFLVLKGCQEIKDENGNDLSGNGDNHDAHCALLQDTQDWIYERTFMVQPRTRVKLYACYADATVSHATAQYFRGAYDGGNCDDSDENSVQILGGNGTGWEKIRVIYDFKTNRLMGAWVPSGEISESQAIAADVMIMRNHQEDATCITLAEGKSLTDVKTVYGTLRFNRWTLNNKDANSHQPLPLAQQQTIYERGLYFISFPFDVHLSDAFGLGTYGTHWVISTYNGKRRAERGYFAEDCINEDCTNWDYIWDPTDFVMEANVGYLLSLDLELMKDDDNSFWPHDINYRELFFPSQVELATITKKNYTMPELDPAEYECTINLNTDGQHADRDRRVKDSYWRCIGVPSFADYSGLLTDSLDKPITWQPDGDNLPFLYEWNVTNNNLVVRSATNYRFRPTFAYLIQNGGEINWTAVNINEPNPIIARERSEAISNYEWKIALLRNGNTEDQTFVRISDNEAVTAAFDFNQDLAKEFNYGANIYTLVGYERLAANSLPMSDSTTIIPLGVSAQEAGDYTITMPEGVESIGITLVDNETGIHTNLSAGQEYTLTLNNGICENRLFIEVSPIQNTPTDLEYTTEDTREQTTRKMLIDGILYLIRDGVIYDAQGHRL